MNSPRDLTADERAAIEAVRNRPDDKIDTTDMPEVTDWSRAVRGALYRHSRTRHRADPAAD